MEGKQRGMKNESDGMSQDASVPGGDGHAMSLELVQLQPGACGPLQSAYAELLLLVDFLRAKLVSGGGLRQRCPVCLSEARHEINVSPIENGTSTANRRGSSDSLSPCLMCSFFFPATDHLAAVLRSAHGGVIFPFIASASKSRSGTPARVFTTANITGVFLLWRVAVLKTLRCFGRAARRELRRAREPSSTGALNCLHQASGACGTPRMPRALAKRLFSAGGRCGQLLLLLFRSSDRAEFEDQTRTRWRCSRAQSRAEGAALSSEIAVFNAADEFFKVVRKDHNTGASGAENIAVLVSEAFSSLLLSALQFFDDHVRLQRNGRAQCDAVPIIQCAHAVLVRLVSHLSAGILVEPPTFAPASFRHWLYSFDDPSTLVIAPRQGREADNGLGPQFFPWAVDLMFFILRDAQRAVSSASGQGSGQKARAHDGKLSSNRNSNSEGPHWRHWRGRKGSRSAEDDECLPSKADESTVGSNGQSASSNDRSSEELPSGESESNFHDVFSSEKRHRQRRSDAFSMQLDGQDDAPEDASLLQRCRNVSLSAKRSPRCMPLEDYSTELLRMADRVGSENSARRVIAARFVMNDIARTGLVWVRRGGDPDLATLHPSNVWLTDKSKNVELRVRPYFSATVLEAAVPTVVRLMSEGVPADSGGHPWDGSVKAKSGLLLDLSGPDSLLERSSSTSSEAASDLGDNFLTLRFSHYAPVAESVQHGRPSHGSRICLQFEELATASTSATGVGRKLHLVQIPWEQILTLDSYSSQAPTRQRMTAAVGNHADDAMRVRLIFLQPCPPVSAARVCFVGRSLIRASQEIARAEKSSTNSSDGSEESDTGSASTEFIADPQGGNAGEVRGPHCVANAAAAALRESPRECFKEELSDEGSRDSRAPLRPPIRRPRDPVPFMYAWDADTVEDLDVDVLYPVRRATETADLDEARALTHQRRPIHRFIFSLNSSATPLNPSHVAIAIRKCYRSRLELFSQLLPLTSDLYSDWRIRRKFYERSLAFAGDVFAWGCLPVRAITAPEQWVPLPSGYLSGYPTSSISQDGCEMQVANLRRALDTADSVMERSATKGPLSLAEVWSWYVDCNSKAFLRSFRHKTGKTLFKERHPYPNLAGSAFAEREARLNPSVRFQPEGCSSECPTDEHTSELVTILTKACGVGGTRRGTLLSMTHQGRRNPSRDQSLTVAIGRLVRRIGVKSLIGSPACFPVGPSSGTTQRANDVVSGSVARDAVKDVAGLPTTPVMSSRKQQEAAAALWSEQQQQQQQTGSNLTGPSLNWRESALFSLGHNVDYYFNEPAANFSRAYTNVNGCRVLESHHSFEREAEYVIWSEDEIAMYMQKFLTYGKDFRRISIGLAGARPPAGVSEYSSSGAANIASGSRRVWPNVNAPAAAASHHFWGIGPRAKSESQCVDFYYRFKHLFHLKESLHEMQVVRGGSGRSDRRGPLASTGSAGGGRRSYALKALLVRKALDRLRSGAAALTQFQTYVFAGAPEPLRERAARFFHLHCAEDVNDAGSRLITDHTVNLLRAPSLASPWRACSRPQDIGDRETLPPAAASTLSGADQTSTLSDGTVTAPSPPPFLDDSLGPVAQSDCVADAAEMEAGSDMRASSLKAFSPRVKKDGAGAVMQLEVSTISVSDERCDAAVDDTLCPWRLHSVVGGNWTVAPQEYRVQELQAITNFVALRDRLCGNPPRRRNCRTLLIDAVNNENLQAVCNLDYPERGYFIPKTIAALLPQQRAFTLQTSLTAVALARSLRSSGCYADAAVADPGDGRCNATPNPVNAPRAAVALPLTSGDPVVISSADADLVSIVPKTSSRPSPTEAVRVWEKNANAREAWVLAAENDGAVGNAREAGNRGPEQVLVWRSDCELRNALCKLGRMFTCGLRTGVPSKHDVPAMNSSSAAASAACSDFLSWERDQNGAVGWKLLIDFAEGLQRLETVLARFFDGPFLGQGQLATEEDSTGLFEPVRFKLPETVSVLQIANRSIRQCLEHHSGAPRPHTATVCRESLSRVVMEFLHCLTFESISEASSSTAV